MAFIVGFIAGFLITGFTITGLVTQPLMQEAIKRGYAAYVVPADADPNKQNTTVFTWK